MKLNDIGFFIPNIDNSSFYNTVFDTIKQFIDNNPYNEIVVFTSQSIKLSTNSIPILHLSHAKFFDGTMFVFDVPSIIITKYFPNIKDKYLYATNAPWLNNSENMTYSYWKDLLCDPELNIIASTDQLHEIYGMCWKQTQGVAEEFDYAKLLKIISK